MEGKKSTWNRKKIINWIQCFNGNKCLPLRPSQCLGKDGQSCPITFVGRWAVKSQPLQCTRTNYGDSKPQLEWSKWPFHGIKGGQGESPNSRTTVLLDLFPQRLLFPSAVHLSKHFSLLCSAQWLREQRCRTGSHRRPTAAPNCEALMRVNLIIHWIVELMGFL